MQKKELVWFGCFYIFLLTQTMLPSNDQIAKQSCSFGQQQMAILFGVEKYTHNRFQLSDSVPLKNFFTLISIKIMVSLVTSTKYVKLCQNLIARAHATQITQTVQ